MKLILLSGVAGVGKSTYIKENLADAIIYHLMKSELSLVSRVGIMLKYSKLCTIELVT